MNSIRLGLIAGALMTGIATAGAQQTAADSVLQQHVNGKRLSIGGYGEAAYSRNFYSDNGKRYSNAPAYKNDPSHGRFDIPHAVIYIGYDFGKGWTFGTEIEFEHGGTGGAIEYEAEESIEYESETEKGGEVELEQFWIQKSFGKAFNIRAGHIVVPVGLTNAHHEPLNFFTVYRPEGENTILPCTWHQTGVALWGRSGDFRYEAQLVAGLNALNFSRSNWIQGGTKSPYEFEVANKYGVSARVDNYSIPGLRIGVSGYYGQSMHNTTPHDMEKGDAKRVKGNVYIGALDFTYNRHNWLVRGNADYGYVSDAQTIASYTYPGTSLVKPNESGSNKYFGSHAIATMVEAGYDVFSQIEKMRRDKQKLYVFGHFEYYDSSIGNTTSQWTGKKILAGGINYQPMPQICIKAEYNHRMLKRQYNNEPAINIGVTYQGFFL
ncbi:MAG: hypothetical protein Q4F85_02465 [Prevotella sp.]|nr:hypothetical protein [Prevotella sp.]